MKRLALVGMLVAMAIVHAIVAFWTPVQGAAWHCVEHAGTWSWTFAGAIGELLARAHAVHVILTPAVEVALVLGVFVVATRRLPQSEWRDVLGIALVSAMIWIAQPSAGVTWFHLPSVATNVYGAAVAVWFLAPWRCGWTVPRALWPVLAIAGYLAGTSTREIAAATFGLALASMARRRSAWMWLGLGGLVAGIAVGFVHAPGFALGAWSSVPIADAGRLVTLIAALVVVGSLLGVLADDPPDPTEPRWFIAWFGIAIVCLLDPRADDTTYLPATIALVIAALPYATWLARSRRYRHAVTALIVIVHASAWSSALRAYHELGADGRERLAILEHTRAGEIAIVPPYAQTSRTAWVFGDDLGSAAARQRIAEAFGLRDIAVAPPFRGLEPNPNLDLELVVDGAPQATIAAAGLPKRWAGELSVAREQFTQLVARLRAFAGEGVSARLVVRGVHFERPLVAAWFEHGELVAPRVTHASADDADRIVTTIDPSAVPRFTEAWVLHGGTATRVPYDNGHPQIRPLVSELYMIVTCDAARCLAADAFTPRF